MPAFCPAFLVARLFLLQTCRIQQHQARQFDGRRGRDDFTPEAALRQQRDAATMVQVSMRQQQEIDRSWVKTHRLGILLGQLAPALVQAAIDEDALTRTFNQVTGTGNTLVGPVE